MVNTLFEIQVFIEPVEEIEVKVDFIQDIGFVGNGGGTDNYEDLRNKPLINEIKLIGNVNFGYNNLSEKPRPITNVEMQQLIDKLGGL